MKKNAKVIIASLSLLSAFAVATPSVANADSALVAPKASASSAITTKTVKINVTKTGTDVKSEAAGFMGDSVKVTLDGNKVTSVTVHLDGSNMPMAKGMDLSKVITSLTINGVKGEAENVAADGSSLDYVFSGDAYKEGKGILNITINAMGRTMNESADITFDKIPNTTPATKPSTNKDTKKPSKKAKKTTKKAKATKRTLKHNAYIYGKNAKRVNKKVLKKNHKVNTYGKAIKLHGKYFYRIATNQYVKKANF